MSHQVKNNKKTISTKSQVVLSSVNSAQHGSFFRLHVARKHLKKISCYKRYKNSRIFLDEKTKYQPWIIKKKPESG
jgi:hypothetical protein